MKVKISLNQAIAQLDGLLRNGFRIQNPPQELEEALDYKLEERLQCEWQEEAEAAITNMFEDVEPVYRFNKPVSIENHSQGGHRIGSGVDLLLLRTKQFEYRLSVIADFYREIEKRAYVPLEYIASKCILRHYQRTCQIKHGTNEDKLCRHMFQNTDVGEFVDLGLISGSIFHDEIEEGVLSESDALGKIKNAFGGVNKDTIEEFGFPVFTKETNSIRINFPQ